MLTLPSGSAFDSSVRIAIEQLQQEGCRYDHILLAAAEGSTARSAPLQLLETAAGGLDALRYKLRSQETRFALLRVQARLLLVVSVGQDLTGLKRAQVLVQGRALQSSLGASLFAAVTIVNASQLTSALVGSKLQLEGFAHIASPNLTQDFRASWSSNSGASTITRARPSAPCSPEEAGHDANWSRPVSDIGHSHRSDDSSMTASMSIRAKSYHSSALAKLTEHEHTISTPQGIMIDLESVIDGPRYDNGIRRTSMPPPLPPKTDLPPLPPSCNEGSEEDKASPRLLSGPILSSDAVQILQKPIQLRKTSDPDRPTCNRLASTASEERRHLSDERERIRVDEVIRDEVMKKLRAEQQSLLNAVPKSPAGRTPRFAISPPLAPPPPFALPPAPPSPSPSAASSRRPVSINSPRLPPETEKKSDSKSNPTATSDTHSATPTGPQFVDSLAISLADDPRLSESHESIRSSIQSLSLWEFADTTSQRASFLSLPGLLPSSKDRQIPSQSKRPASGSVSPNQGRSRQASGSDSVASLGLNNNRYTTSSSRGSVAASLIFDKELPVPPDEAADTSTDGEEWTGALGSPDSMEHPSAPWINDFSVPSQKLAESSFKRSVEAEEMRDLRDRLVQAEARAKAAEEAAQVAVREAQSETRRLAEELANVERGTKDKMEAEAVRRAKWASEQASRNQLDAYERSKLESEEKRRRRAIEEQRQLECDRAKRIREEQEWREQEAERIKQEYELKVQHLAEREAKLKAEAEAKERHERERIQQEEARASYRRERLTQIKQAIKADDDGGEAGITGLPSGWLNLQVEGTTQWKRRWYQMSKEQLVLSRSPTDSSLKVVVPLDPAHLVSISDDGDDWTMSHTLQLEVLLDCEEHSSQKERSKYLISTDTREAKEEIALIIEAIASD